MLHLQGFDHIKNKQAEEMEQLEIKILNQLGFDDPYN
jgi:probable rRNA maturation factor